MSLGAVVFEVEVTGSSSLRPSRRAFPIWVKGRTSRGTSSATKVDNIDPVLPGGHRIIAKKIAWACAHARPILLAFSDELKLPQRDPTKIDGNNVPNLDGTHSPCSTVAFSEIGAGACDGEVFE